MNQSLKPRLLDRDHMTFELATFDGENRSGFEPFQKNVLVLPDMPLDKTSGDVYLPDDLVTRAAMSAESGVIVECGPEAFCLNSDGSHWKSTKPAPGDRVIFEKYAGVPITGVDGKKYRLMSDSCIGARYRLTESKDEHTA